MLEAKSELERYLESTPESRARWTEARQYLPGGDSRNSIFWKPYPIFITDASGSRVMDADNVQRIDFINTMTTMILGHGPEAVMDAVRRQLNRGIGYNAPNERQVELARILCERIPSFDLVRFTNSGTEATLNTLRAARAFTGRTRFAKVEGGYHGTHDGVTVSVRVDPAAAGDAESPVPVLGSAGLTPGVSEQVVVIPFNDAASSRRILEESAEDLAAIIIEPVMGSVGMVPAQQEYLAFPEGLCHGKRHRAHFRRGYQLPCGARRLPGILRHHPGHDGPGKDHRRGPARGRLWWTKRYHGPV